MLLVYKEIPSTTTQLFKRDTCQVRPMARCPSVPSEARSGTPRQYESPVSRSSLFLQLPLLPHDHPAYDSWLIPKRSATWRSDAPCAGYFEYPFLNIDV